jgi:hypothetical protein
MAKGDHARMQNAVDYQGGLAQNNLTNLRQDLIRQNQGLENRFNVAADLGGQDYGNIMGGYSSFLNNLPGGANARIDPRYDAAANRAIAGYQNFADTGGYSPEDIAALRARAIAPTRAIYANAQTNLNRNRALQGGYSPNYAAASAKMARELSNTIGDQNVNVEAALADAIRQGKLAGLGGMNTVALGQEGAQLGVNALNSSSALQNAALANSALSGMGNLYGTAPGLAQMYGNQLLSSSGQLGNQAGLQNQLAQIRLGGQGQVSQTPGNYQQALGNIGGTLNLGGQIARGVSGLFG